MPRADLVNTLSEFYSPPPSLERLLSEGKLSEKEGFYRYDTQGE